MNVKTRIKVGADEFEISEDVKNQIEFFQFSAFFSSIPKVGPNGETDLKLVHRTPQGYNYYSLVSEKAQMEYKFGQSQEKPGTLFGKGWEPLYTKSESATNSAPIGASTSAPIGAQTAAPVQAAPAQNTAAPIGNTQAPVAVADVQAATPVQAGPTPVVVPPTAAATTPAAAPKSAAATDVLKRFGIQTK